MKTDKEPRIIGKKTSLDNTQSKEGKSDKPNYTHQGWVGNNLKEENQTNSARHRSLQIKTENMWTKPNEFQS